MDLYDCIFIPGGGLNPDGSLPPWTQARLQRALELEGQTGRIACLSGGTVHKPPPLDGGGFPLFESRMAADELIKSGINPRKVSSEISSFDTIGNAYFSRLLFSQPLGFKKILIITSGFHLPRVQAVFNWIYHLTPYPADWVLSYESTPDLGLPQQALKARKARESNSLQHFKFVQKRIKSLEECTTWLYTEHAAYAPGGRAEQLSDDVLNSY